MTANEKTTRDFVLLGLLLWFLWPKTGVNVTYSYGGEVGGTDDTGPLPPVQVALPPDNVLPLPSPPPNESGDYVGQLRAIGGTMYEWNGYEWVFLDQGTTYVNPGGAGDAAGGSSDYLPYATL